MSTTPETSGYDDYQERVLTRKGAMEQAYADGAMDALGGDDALRRAGAEQVEETARALGAEAPQALHWHPCSGLAPWREGAEAKAAELGIALDFNPSEAMARHLAGRLERGRALLREALAGQREPEAEPEAEDSAPAP